MIYCHMFPLNIRIPRYKESIILCVADKICAIKETIEYRSVSISKLYYYYIHRNLENKILYKLLINQ